MLCKRAFSNVQFELVHKAESGRPNNYKTGRPNLWLDGRFITKLEGRIWPQGRIYNPPTISNAKRHLVILHVMIYQVDITLVHFWPYGHFWLFGYGRLVKFFGRLVFYLFGLPVSALWTHLIICVYNICSWQIFLWDGAQNRCPKWVRATNENGWRWARKKNNKYFFRN